MDDKKNKRVETDDELVSRAQKGDKQAEDELLLRHAGIVRSKARGFFLMGGETEDLIQEGMIGLFGAIRDYKVGAQGCSFKNFAYLCVTRRIIDAVKIAASKKNVPLNNYVDIVNFDGDIAVSPEDELIRSENRLEFMQTMSRTLSDFEFKIMVMYMDGMSCAEICAATGRSEKSVDNAIQRSKKKLQKLLKR